MNWKLIFLLSLIAIPMAFATVFLIPYNFEPPFWLVIFAACGFIIAKNCTRKFFLNGVMLSIFNSIWITAIHFLLWNKYLVLNPQFAAMKDVSPAMMRYGGLAMGPLFGALSGLLQGLFALVAAKILKK